MRGREERVPSPHLFREALVVTVEATIRLVTMVLAGAVACAGIVVMAGWLTREGLPVETRILLGAVVFLYGVYKFTVTYFRKPEGDDR